MRNDIVTLCGNYSSEFAIEVFNYAIIITIIALANPAHYTLMFDIT